MAVNPVFIHTIYSAGKAKKLHTKPQKTLKNSVILYLVYKLWKERQDGVLRINRQVHGGDKKNWIRRLRIFRQCGITKSQLSKYNSFGNNVQVFGSMPRNIFSVVASQEKNAWPKPSVSQ